jgi:hypothetical protein
MHTAADAANRFRAKAARAKTNRDPARDLK